MSILPYLVPNPDDREPVSATTLPHILLPTFLLLFLGYLARRPNTYLIRLALLPFVVWTTLWAMFAYYVPDPEQNSANFSKGILCLIQLMKALEFGLMPGGLFRTGESIQERDFQSRWQSFQDAAATTFSPRGIGWQSSMYGTPYTPPQTRDTSSRPRFLFQTLCSYVQNFLLLDIVESAFGFVPGITTPQGRTIFFANLSPLPRYAVSTTIHILTGAWFMLTYQMIYDLVTLVAVGVFGQRSDAWPPVFDRPWAQYSVHAFWAKGWHQLLRQTLLIAAYPSTWLFGRTGLVFGVFLASGLFHDWAMYCMGRGRDGRVIVFFGAQAVALMLEALWKKVTGKRVGGWFGGIWTAVWIVGLGQMFTDAVHQRGIAASNAVPPELSIIRRFVLPALGLR